jgi:hypothetical protein
MSITNGSGGVGFMSMVMGGAITAGCRTGGDDHFPIKKIYSYINIAPFV